MVRQYILRDGKPVPTDDINEWGRFMGNGDARTVDKTDLPGGVHVSTVFLGLDHNFYGEGDPVLWETMIFGGPHDQYQDRYTSVEAAKLGHERAVKVAKGELKDEAPK